jgi:hypothetical protein
MEEKLRGEVMFARSHWPNYLLAQAPFRAIVDMDLLLLLTLERERL